MTVDGPGLRSPLRTGLRTLRLQAATARRTVRRYGVRPTRVLARLDDRPVFVVGSPRSGTSFTAVALGGVTGFADLGEVNALKAAVPELTVATLGHAARRTRSVLARAQRFGMVAGLRAIEQTPEATFIVPALAAAYPLGRFLHLQRDGRDVVSSLMASGWLRPSGRASGASLDDAGQPYGEHARFWVEPERRAEFAQASEATRCAWAWRRYETAAQNLLAELADRSLAVRYEQLVSDPAAEAARVADFLGVPEQAAELAGEFGHAFATSVGRYGRDLQPPDLADIEREAGLLLQSLGYGAAGG